MKKYLLFLFLILLFHSCYYDNLDELNPTAGLFTNCDTTQTISFINDIEPIFVSTCGATNSCHNASAVNGFFLDTYSHVLTLVNSGDLMGGILHTAGFSAMPKGGGMLDDCSISKIQAWINQGKNNN